MFQNRFEFLSRLVTVHRFPFLILWFYFHLAFRFLFISLPSVHSLILTFRNLKRVSNTTDALPFYVHHFEWEQWVSMNLSPLTKKKRNSFHHQLLHLYQFSYSCSLISYSSIIFQFANITRTELPPPIFFLSPIP